jgi:flavin reductase
MLNAMASHASSSSNPAALPAGLQKADYRNAMARLGAAVNIITTDGPAGRAGFTASAVCSVTDEPPTLLVCLNRSASVYPAFKANGVLCVNVLAAGHQSLSAAVSFDCRVVHATSAGTHDVLFCEAVAIAIGGAAQGLIYFDRRYHEIAAPPQH